MVNYIKQWVTCRRARRPTETQRMEDLPADRVHPSPPLSFCGIVLAPFTLSRAVKRIRGTVLIFPCLCSRAFHVVWLDDLTTDVFVNTPQRFIALREAVRQIRSDQGTNVVSSKTLTKKGLHRS